MVEFNEFKTLMKVSAHINFFKGVFFLFPDISKYKSSSVFTFHDFYALLFRLLYGPEILHLEAVKYKLKSQIIYW